MIRPPSGYLGPHDPARDQRLCARCGDPIQRLAEHVDPSWLGTLEAVDFEARRQLHAYAVQLATLWLWAYQAIDGAAHGNGQADMRTYQRAGDPTAQRYRLDDGAVVLRARCRQEAKRIRDAADRLRRELGALERMDERAMEAERERWDEQQEAS